MSNPYRTAPKRKKRARDLELERFVDELEDARFGAVVEHLRIAFAGLLAAYCAGYWLLWTVDQLHSRDSLNSVSLDVIVGVAAFLGMSLGFYLVAIYAFHVAYRVTFGRRIEWPRLRTVVNVAATLR